MADINTSVNGIPITVKKLDTGEIVYASENWPGATFGDNGGLVPGHAGGILSAANMQSFADSLSSSIDGKNRFIADAREQINDPKIDPAWKETLKGQITKAQADVQSLQEGKAAALSLASEAPTLISAIGGSADTNGEAAGVPTAADIAATPENSQGWWTIRQRSDTGAWEVVNSKTGKVYLSGDAGSAISDAIRLGDMPASLRSTLLADAEDIQNGKDTKKDTAPTVVKTDVEDGVTTEYLSDGTTRVTTADGTVTKYDKDLNPTKDEEDPTNKSKEDTDAENKYKNQSATDPGPPAQDDGSDPYVSNGQTTIPPADNALPKGGVAPSASTPPARAEWPDAKDVRAILKVPTTYLNGVTDPGKVLGAFGGIVFPYSPQISFSHDATYQTVNPTHSNYTQYFYKNSAVSAISVNAKFTVQNEDDAIILVGVITLLRALTKMKFGPDKDSGAPPPVCRFSAYGNYMLSNVPVTVASFKHDLPDSVDYFQTGNRFKTHGLNFVPVMSTISLTLNPTYSRSEMLRAGVTSTLTGKAQKSGFL